MRAAVLERTGEPLFALHLAGRPPLGRLTGTRSAPDEIHTAGTGPARERIARGVVPPGRSL